MEFYATLLHYSLFQWKQSTAITDNKQLTVSQYTQTQQHSIIARKAEYLDLNKKYCGALSARLPGYPHHRHTNTGKNISSIAEVKISNFHILPHFQLEPFFIFQRKHYTVNMLQLLLHINHFTYSYSNIIFCRKKNFAIKSTHSSYVTESLVCTEITRPLLA